ncbi:fibrillarin-like rRNA/tRNA 2'-O-methyltransferase [Candidatus Micrarchaeota archaeon]|nr:fibrillarin-like rRNA/tRNA 2'-O-methyltransferase [Candidatus Micrarchaeota archaeon]
MEVKLIFPGIYSIKNKILTKNMIKGEKVYGEELTELDGIEYRSWNPFRSKLAAAIKNGLKEVPVKEGTNILYLGVAEGTTASHLSDIIGEKGMLVGIDVSARAMHKFIQLCDKRKNLLPILANADKPEGYEDELNGIEFNLLYQDISQKNQAEIFIKNAEKFLKKGRKGLLVVKARSISQEKKAEKIFEEETNKLEKEFNVIQVISLKPFDKEHVMVYCGKK